jgi:lambda family phage portal protein
MKLFIERSPLIETLTSLGGSIAPEGRGDLPKQPRRHKRSGYKGGKMTRTDRDFGWSGQSQLPQVYRSLRRLRGRSRELARNNDWFIKFLRMCRVNVIGPEGMTFEAQAKTPRGKPDKPLNDLVEDHWRLWGYPENASANQRLSWHDIQLKWITTLARDGEVMFRKVPADNPYGFALKQIDVAWLDETWNGMYQGNRIIMSVEIDANDRHVAYWLTPPGDAYYAGIQPEFTQRTRVPAEFIYFDFVPFDQNCGDDTITRGIPWVHAAMLKLWTIDEFEYSAVVAARIGASKMGFFKNRQGDPLTLTKEEMERATDGRGPTDDDDEDDDDPDLFDHVEPGQFGDIGDKEFESFNPTYPDAMVKPFFSFMLHGVAASIGTEYFSFASDFTEVNFSAGRLGVQQEQDNWGILHSLAKHRYRGVNLDWLQSSMLNNAFRIEPKDIIRLQEPKITPRGFGYYDPLKDMQAYVMGIDNGLDNRTDILAGKGKDFSKNLANLKSEKDEAAKAGVVFVGGKPTSGSAPENQPANANDPNGDTTDTAGK